MTRPKRIAPGRCCGIVVDVQGFFLEQLERRLRSRMRINTRNLVRLLGYFHIPIVVTLERSVALKGTLPPEIAALLGARDKTFEKDFFDLTKERPIRAHLTRLEKPQAIVAGCETDVCVLHSVLGLLSLGYEVFVVEDLLFSSTREVAAAVARMRDAGAVLMSYKTLYYELIEAVDGGRHGARLLRTFGPLPDDLPDVARW
jgi:nicotinamidase-related amidase